MAKTIAIVGASTDRAKFGNKAVRAYKDRGWTVYPVNPKADIVEGIKAYASVSEVPEPLDRISMYVPPAVGLKMLDELAKKPHQELFLNPGSEDDTLVAEAKARGLNPIQACSIVDIEARVEEGRQ